MKKGIIVDLTPSGWQGVSKELMSSIFSYLISLSVVKEVHITRHKLTVLVNTDHRWLVDKAKELIEKIILPPHPDEQKILDQITAECCGDNSCHFKPVERRGGMGTNGGCRCFKMSPNEERMRSQIILRGYRDLYEARLSKILEASNAWTAVVAEAEAKDPK